MCKHICEFIFAHLLDGWSGVPYSRSMSKPNLLDKVRAKLADQKGEQLFKIAAATGISYDTLLRIREQRADPAFGKVQQLAVYFRVVR